MRSFIGLANRSYNLIYWLATCLFIIASFDAIAGQATLTWDPSSSSGVTNYRLYYGQSSGNYTSNINTGLTTSYTVTGLQDGQTYYFAVTAMDGSTESGFSNEVSKTIPALLPPSANFSATPTSGTAPLTVNFTNASSGDITNRSWNFGDGSTSTANNPSHTYSTEGTYNVSLTVTGPGGSDSKVMNGLITVSAPLPAAPSANFSATPTSGTAPLTVNFTNTSSGDVSSRSWNFGDGNTSTANNPSHTYSAAGTYTITLIVTGTGGSDTLTKSSYITVSPADDGGAGDDNISQQDSGAQGLLVLASGHYNASVNQGGHYWVPVTSPSGFSADVAMQAAPQDGARINTGYVTDSPRLDFNANFVKSGTHYVWVRGLATSGSNNSIHIGLDGQANTTADRIEWASYNQWTWTQATMDGVRATVQVANSGEHTLNVWMREAGVKVDKILLTTDASFVPSGTGPAESPTSSPTDVPIADFDVSSVSGVVPLTVNFTDLSTGDINVDSWSWSFGDGVTSAQQNPSHTYSAAGTYTVSLTVTGPGGSNSKVMNDLITVSAPLPDAPTADFNATPTTGEAPLLVNFSDASSGEITSRSWDFGDGSTSTAINAVKSYETPGIYTAKLTVTGPGGTNTRTRTNYINVTAPAVAPVSNFSATPRSGEAPLTVNFTDISTGDVSNHLWDFGDGSTSTAENPNHTYSVAGTYAVSLTVTGAGGSDKKVLNGYISVTDATEPPDSTISGLISAWGFEEGNGNQILDSENVNHGTIAGAKRTDEGWFGKALSFDGIDDWITVNFDSSLNLSTDMTLEAWVYPTKSMTGWRNIILKEQANGLNYGLYANSDTNQPVGSINVGVDRNLYGGEPLPVNEWTHLATTYDGQTQRLYINGVEVAEQPISGAMSTSSGVLRIGGNNSWLDEFFQGYIDEVRIYERALREDEILADMLTPVGDDPSTNPQESFLETGEIQVDHNWQRVTINNLFLDPVVVAKPIGYNNSHPAVVRIRNVDSTGFDIRLQEWDYLDGTHAKETVSYLVMEKGSHTLADGTQVEAGRITTNSTGSYQSVSFDTAFLVTPVVLAAVSTFNESDAVTLQLRNIKPASFQVRMREQEANRQRHATEEISYIAWEPSSGTVDGIKFTVGNTGRKVKHNWYDISFNASTANPIFLADMQTTYGGDTSILRWRNKDEYGVEICVEEEQSKDSEVKHTTEDVGFVVFSLLP